MKLRAIIISSLMPLAAFAGTDMKEIQAPAATQTYEDPFYIEASGGGLFLNPPSRRYANIYNFPITGVGANTLESFKTQTVDIISGGSFGYIFSRDPGAGLGKNLRLELSGSYFGTSETGSGHTTRDFAVANPNGSGSAFFLVGSGAGIDTPAADSAFKANYNLWNLELKIKTDYELMPNLTVTPMAGLSYHHFGQHFDDSTSGFGPAAGGGVAFGNIDQRDRVSSDYYGVLIGADFCYKITEKLSASVGTELTGAWAHTDFHTVVDGTGNVTEDNALGGGDFSPPSAGEASSKDDSAVFILANKAGLCYDFGPVKVKVEGLLDYWSAVPVVEDASFAVGSGALHGRGATMPSHTDNTSMLNYGAQLTVIVPF